jgi:cytochrome P450
MMTISSIERAATLIALGALAWRSIPPSISPSFWRAFRVAARWLTAAILVYASGMALLTCFAPAWLLRGVSLAALGAVFALRWYSRETRGRALGWPPGSLQPLALAPWLDRDFFFAEHRRLGALFKTSLFFRPVVCMVGLSDGLDFFKRHEASLDSPPLPFGRFIPGGFLRHMPRDRHVATKAVFRDAIVYEVYTRLEPFVRTTIRDELVRSADASSASNERGVPPRRHIQRAVFVAWARIFFHVEPGTPEFARLKALYQIIDIRNPKHASDEKVRVAIAEISELLHQQLETGRSAAGEPPRSFLDAMAKSRVESIDDPTVIGNLIYMMHTTWSDVSGLLQWVFRMLTEHSEWVERLRDAPETEPPANDGPPALATRVVMETLRLEQSEYLYRVTTRRIEHAGFVIPRGWLVRLCVRESHRDPAVFADPEEFNPDRFLDRSFTRHQYSPFGAGLRHDCLGAALTMMVGRLFVDALAKGFEWRTVADGPHEFSAWRHWRPSSSWRVLVETRP